MRWSNCTLLLSSGILIYRSWRIRSIGERQSARGVGVVHQRGQTPTLLLLLLLHHRSKTPQIPTTHRDKMPTPTPHNRRLPIRPALGTTQPAAATQQDFAPRSPAKKHNPASSPESSSPRSASPVPAAAEDAGFTADDASRLDNDDRARHEALRAQHRAEIDELIRRPGSRHGRGYHTLEGRPTQPAISQHARGAPACRSTLRRTGAALLEYRRNQKTEMLARQTARRSEAARGVVLDTTLADKTAAMIERQARRRRGLTSKPPVDRCGHPATAASTSYETCGTETSAHVAAAERQRKHTEEVGWACLQMERVLERLSLCCANINVAV